jgi:hypothetical protein
MLATYKSTRHAAQKRNYTLDFTSPLKSTKFGRCINTRYISVHKLGNFSNTFDPPGDIPKSQEDSDPIKYGKVLVSTLLHDFTKFAECIGTDCK